MTPIARGAGCMMLDAMPAALTDDERQQIIDLFDTGMSCNAIARQVGRSTNTVSRIAKDVGHAWGQANIVRAHEAARAFTAERRAVAAARAQERVDEILETFWDPREQVVVMHGGRGEGSSTEVVRVAPDARAISDLAKAVNTLQRTVLDISKHDVKADEGQEAGMLVQFVDTLRGGS